MESAEGRNRWALVGWFSWTLVAGLIAAVLLILTARWTAYGELASHFRWHLGLIALLSVLPIALARQPRQVAGLALLGVWGVSPEAALWLGTPPLEASRPRLEASSTAFDIVCVNVLRPNDRRVELLETVLARDADVVCLLEVSSEWRADALAILGSHYPYRAEGLDTDRWSRHTWGSLLFSKTPITSIEADPIWNEGRRLRPVVRCDVKVADETVTIQLVHAQRPGNARRLADRRRHFGVLSEPLDAAQRIIIGDFNTTSTSPIFGALCEATGLRDTRRGFGRLSSWSFPREIPGPLDIKFPRNLRPAIAIDHVLVSDGLVVLRRGTFVAPGSDHDGIFARLALEERPLRQR